MGKRIISQRRGTGTRRFVALSHKSVGPAQHKHVNAKQQDVQFGEVKELMHSPAHSAPIARIQYEDGKIVLIQASETMAVGDIIATGQSAPVQNGNTLPLGNIPEGTNIYNIESRPGDGGKFVRSSGVFARVVAKIGNNIVVRMPSKKEKTFSAQCRATIGVIAGGGRTDKPFMKAGRKMYAKRARGKLYPVVSAVSMNAMEHPYGSGRGSHKGKPTIAPRNAPAGRNVGKHSPRRTGKQR